jgi:hypothetical protein
MKNVFISYRHVEPDQSLAQSLATSLTKRHLKVFVDTKMLVGTKWVKEIEKQIRMAHYFIVLLSKDSIRSDMVRREVDLAYKMTQKTKNRLSILPIRVAFEGELPYDMGAYLGSIQYALWKDGDAHETVCDQIVAAIEKAVALPRKGKADPDSLSSSGIQELARATENAGAPLPAADPRFALDTGAVKLSSPFYVRRKADSHLEGQISTDGVTVVVKGPRQMGKSSLLARAHAEAREKQRKTCYLDFQSIGDAELSSLESLLKCLARKLAREFKSPVRPEEQWDSKLPPMDNLTYFIEDAILVNEQLGALVLFDEADRVFQCEYRDDFFAMVRAWHNSRATNDRWNKLNLVIAHSTEPYLWIKNLNQSPFNVGYRIELEEFTVDQISDLNKRHGSPLRTSAEIQQLLDLVGGHPYLVRQGLYTLKVNSWTMANLKEAASSDTGPFGDHLRQWAWYLEERKELQSALRQLLQSGQVTEEAHFQRLRAAGLVRGPTRDAVRLRCQLYQDYFAYHL